MASPTAYLDALLTTLDADSKELAQSLLSSPTPRALVDLLIRLAADSPTAPPINPTSPSFLSRYTPDTWSDHREQAQAELRRLHAKRKRSATPPPTPSKRAKLLPATELPVTPAPALPDPNDKPVFTLHALSLSSPMRKKLDITLHERSIRLGDASFALSSLKRAFLLPTRGKSKPHWTVVLMSSDQVVKPSKGSSAPVTEGFQIVFGVDAEPSTAFSSTAYPSDKETHAKGNPTRPVLLEFLRRLPIPFYEPSADIFSPSSGGGLGIAAYRGAKEGTLWFLSSGILAENKPCEFWALEGIDDADDAIRLQSATGRTCSVFIRRKGEVVEDDGQTYEGEGEETDFGMVEGREQDGIRGWVRRLRASFGKVASGEGVASGSGEGEKDAVNGVAPMLDDDDDDSDFGVSSEDSDGGSPTESSDSDEEAAGSGGGEASGSGSEDDSDAEDEGDDEEEGEERPLDPARHPLMRAGAMPKMNKAAMDMAVGMVVDELIGGHEVEQDGEEDELDD